MAAGRIDWPRIATGHVRVGARGLCAGPLGKAGREIHEPLVDLSRFTLDTRLLGLTLIADLDKGRIFEVGRDHNQRWHIDGLKGPVDMQILPNGRVLIAENHARRITERDKPERSIGNRRRRHSPRGARLPNGNTFIATYNEILEVTPDGAN